MAMVSLSAPRALAQAAPLRAAIPSRPRGAAGADAGRVVGGLPASAVAALGGAGMLGAGRFKATRRGAHRSTVAGGSDRPRGKVGLSVKATSSTATATKAPPVVGGKGHKGGRDHDTLHRSASQAVLSNVQAHFVERLEAVSLGGESSKGDFAEKTWDRDGGAHGGGKRFGVVQSRVFNRASVNYSAVYYDDLPEKAVKSATALSVIIHPNNPFAPSMHCHFSYTEPREGAPYWRMISDLNPSIHNPTNKNRFEKALKDLCPQDLFDDGKLFGDRYFFIPELNMYRGTSHLFLAKVLDTEMAPDDSRDLAEKLATATIDTYTDIVQDMLDAHPADSVTEHERELQLAYHTAYFYQVLFLDCGTTAGLLTHAENDVGTLASLPTYISPKLLRTWLREKVQPPHDLLLRRILDVLAKSTGAQGGDDVRGLLLSGSGSESDAPCHVTDEVRQALATTVREYYMEDRSRTSAQADFDLEWWAKRND